MATWVTHLMIADILLGRFPDLDRRSFAVGNIAPDCNVESADWSTFTPSREVTHRMTGDRKTLSDADGFCEEYITGRMDMIGTREEYSFLLGYYAHLLTDAAFTEFVRDAARIENAWKRITADPELCEIAMGLDRGWDSVKRVIPKDRRLSEIYSMEADYLRDCPDSAYLTEVLPLEAFPDYLDFLPKGCIVRKIGVMGYLPKSLEGRFAPIVISRDEYVGFIHGTAELVGGRFDDLIQGDSRF